MKQLAIPQQTKELKKQLIKTEIPVHSSVGFVNVVNKQCFICAGSQISDINLDKFEINQKITRGKSTMQYCDVRKDGELVVSAEESGHIVCNIVQTHSMLKRFFGLRTSATVAKFTPDGYSVLGANKAGNIIIWDLPTATPQFAINIANDKVSDVCFIDNEKAAVTTLDGVLHFINYRIPIIEQGISEGKTKQAVADYKLGQIKFEQRLSNVIKVEDYLFVIAGDFIYKVSIQEQKIVNKSQQIIKGIAQLSNRNQQIYAGCTDGTIRLFSFDLSEQEIIYSSNNPILSFALTEELFIVGTTQFCLTILSKTQRVKELSQKDQYKKQMTQPRQGIDTVVMINTQSQVSPAASTLIYKCNFAKALEFAIHESFEQTVAVLRELEFMGGRALDLALVGLSDDARVQLYKTVVSGLESEYANLLIRACFKSLKLTQQNMSGIVTESAVVLKQELIELLEAFEDAEKIFL
ncbi:Conserved_hypothetical protein [Hexamita inflata]|uniref:Uncharacterized protein n=1 Tax=Hexamita inflata TaxID=28002 RepID=A0AA86RBP3_9EUKA|nr:Conserved hypothetical protein [Hexamita inflata]CAI9975061.1 Conserved hypothetical protein [Hexamita inflata]